MHRELWETFPEFEQRKPGWAQSSKLRDVAKAMIADGLYSKQSAMIDICASILKHCDAARFVCVKSTT